MPKPAKKLREKCWGKPHRVIEETARKDMETDGYIGEAL